MARQQATRAVLLASASPRRQALLDRMGVPFTVEMPGVDEDASPKGGERAEAFALRLALAKAKAVAVKNPGAVVLGADTVVVIDGDILGKPRDPDEARGMLRRLRGQEHKVITAVAFFGGRAKNAATVSAETAVRFRDYADDEIEAYVASGDPMDKAGAYGIQSEAFHPASEVKGCMLNVVGLPACLVSMLLRGAGIEVPTPELAIPDPCRTRPGGCSLAR